MGKAAEESAEKARAAAERESKSANYVTSHIHESRCENNAGCHGLVGFCCPNLDGTRLGCCGAADVETSAIEQSYEGRPGEAVLVFALIAGLVVTGVMMQRQRAKLMTDRPMLG